MSSLPNKHESAMTVSRDTLLGLNDYSIRKLYSHELQQRICELEQANAALRSKLQEHEQTQRALEASEACRIRVFESSLIPIIVMDYETLRFIDCNRAAAKIFRLPSVADTLHKTLIDISAPFQYDGTSSQEKMHAYIQQAFLHGEVIYEWRHQRPDGELWDGEVQLMTFQAGNRYLLQFTLRDITLRKRYELQLQHLATHDELTGLANRTLLLDRLDHCIHLAHRASQMVAIFVMDIDRLKVVNDSLGHSCGDQLLCAIASRLRKQFRQADTLACMGGDKFVVVLSDVHDIDQVLHVAGKINTFFEQPFPTDSHEVTVSASTGVAIFPNDSREPEQLLRNADLAMARSKKLGGNMLTFYSPEMNQRIFETLELENGIRHALQREEFRLYYQPKVDIKSGKIIGCEALLRWEHSKRGLISPLEFIPLAEETGLIVPLGSWVINEAMRQGQLWQQQGLPPIDIAINISPRQFRQGNLLNIMKEGIRRSGIDPCRLELEITESVIMDEPEKACHTMRELKQLGIRLSLDDFGTGYSSFNYLRKLPVDALKIDKSFINDVTTDSSGASIVASIIGIAKNLGLQAVAEGVEHFDQLYFLVGCECDSYQGFLFSKPIPADEFTTLLKNSK
ncbi:putative bifunctional diguanylate cyclase/phosphodiesterase [Chrysiogenes arsenatis]|uniref:putative bifunctional diguanylate cyclase/phosphodiesterase n=1 Tax=Chrysiogenes arsenatis TaxID=309797 RepID=UPI0006841D26|nr:EAL domain-containing protein [Chrysiogenes arsenatis]